MSEKHGSMMQYNKSLFDNMSGTISELWAIDTSTGTAIVMRSEENPSSENVEYDYDALLSSFLSENSSEEDRDSLRGKLCMDSLKRMQKESHFDYTFISNGGRSRVEHFVITPSKEKDGSVKCVYLSMSISKDAGGKKEDDDPTKKERSVYLKVMMVTATVISLFALICFFGFRGFRKTLYMEQSKNFMTVMAKTSHNISTVMVNKWDDVRYVADELCFSTFESQEDVLAWLRTRESILEKGNNRFFLIDSDDVCLFSDGRTFNWTYDAMLKGDEDDVSVVSVDGYRSVILYPIRLEKTVTAGNEAFTHLVLVSDTEMLDTFLSMQDYGQGSSGYVFHSNGAPVYGMDSSFNVLSMLEKGSFNFGTSAGKIATDLSKGISGCAYASLDGEECYIAYEKLSIDDWYAMIIVPRTLVDENIRAFGASISICIVAVCFGFFSVIAALLVIMNERRKTDSRINASLRKAASALNRAAEAERNANKAKTQFLSSMSHDIRTPMNAVIGLTTLAEKHLSDPVYIKDNLSKIALAGNYLLTLINDVLDISKVESGKMSLNPEPFSLKDCVLGISSILRPQAEAKKQRFEINVHGIANEALAGDEMRLNQIFMNIATNAVKYTHEGGKISINVSEEASGKEGCVKLKYVVSDNGIGMSKDFQSTMYQAFARETDHRINKIQGTGLGLAIVRQLVDLMSGTIECESEVGEGTTFTVSIDLEIDKAKQDDLKLPEMGVLLVDDDEEAIRSAKEAFYALGLDASVAMGKDEAVKALSEVRYGCMVIKWGIPGFDKVVKEAKKAKGTRKCLVIASSYDWSKTRDEAKDAKCDGVVTKPFFKSTLYECISSLMGKGEDGHDGIDGEEEDYGILDGMKVLVAEDNDVNWQIIEELLEMYGIHPTRAENGKACLEMLESSDGTLYELVLMDVQMPIMDGKEATKEIRRSENSAIKDIPIIAMTADAFAEDIQSCLSVGMNGHISKPINMEKLLGVLVKFKKTEG